MKINIKFTSVCATCCHWDDPARAAIRPTNGRNIWEVDTSETNLCMKRRIKTKANAKCQQHKLRLEIY